MSDQGPRVALTFDAEHPDRELCPPGNAQRILDTLAASGTVATFFVQGRWARSQPVLARRIADEGHLVGHHSQFHARMPLLSDDGIRADVVEGEQDIVETTGRDPRPWFRCPFGAGMDDDRVLEVLAELGYRHVGWDVDPEDWNEEHVADDVERLVLEGLSEREGNVIVLMHGWPTATAEALPMILRGLADEGVELVTVDELP